MKPLGEGAGQQLELVSPQMVIMPRRFEVEIEQPAPAIGPLEPGRRWPVEIGKLRRHLAGRETEIGQLRDALGVAIFRGETAQGEQGPPAVDAAVPVEAAVEDRVQRAGAEQILVPADHMVELVRIFAGDMAKRMCAKVVRDGAIENIIDATA